MSVSTSCREKRERTDEIGQDIHACGSNPTLREMATMLSKATGKEIDTLRLSKEEFYSDKHREEVGEVFWPQYRNYVEG
jgi:hypothetical protein